MLNVYIYIFISTAKKKEKKKKHNSVFLKFFYNTNIFIIFDFSLILFNFLLNKKKLPTKKLLSLSSSPFFPCSRI